MGQVVVLFELAAIVGMQPHSMRVLKLFIASLLQIIVGLYQESIVLMNPLNKQSVGVLRQHTF